MNTSITLAILYSYCVTLAAAEVAVQDHAPWNLRAISHRSAHRFPLVQSRNFKYYYNTWAADQTYYAYVIDSGIRTTHKKFEDRAENLWSAYKTCNGTPIFDDSTGHGTHVAGIIASRTYGVAKQARVISVKIFDESGRSTRAVAIDGFIAAVNDIAAKGRASNAVINYSGGGIDDDQVLSKIVDKASSKFGILAVVSSGNHGQYASKCSPAAANTAITVGAVNEDWSIRRRSNFGKAVNILAPGPNILSLSSKGDMATQTMSGTSMAAAHITALALHGMAVHKKQGRAVASFLYQTATKNKVTGCLRGSPNLLANNNNAVQQDCRREPENADEDDAC